MSKRKHFNQQKTEQIVSKPPWGAIIASIVLVFVLFFLAFYDLVTIQGVIIDRKSLGTKQKDTTGNTVTGQPTPTEVSVQQIEFASNTEKNKVFQLESDGKKIDLALQDIQLNEITPEIERRQIGLQALIKQINAMINVVATQKTSLTSQVESELGILQAVQRKLPTNFSVEEQEKDKKTIKDSYPVYFVFNVKISEISYADNLVDAANSVKILSDQIQVVTNQAKQKGKEVTKLQNAVNDRNTKISQAITLVQNAVNILNQIAPQGYPDNISSLKQVRDMLTTARENVQSAANTTTLLPSIKELSK